MNKFKTQFDSNLAFTALKMLNSKVAIDMSFMITNDGSMYYSQDLKIFEDCGTTCCVLGFGAMAMGRIPDECSWGEFCKFYYGIDALDDWEFLFDSRWSNDKLQAAARILIFLNGGPSVPWVFGERYDENKSKEEIIEELKPFIK